MRIPRAMIIGEAGQSESQSCCSCFELTFTSAPLIGKKMIVQSINTGGDGAFLPRCVSSLKRVQSGRKPIRVRRDRNKMCYLTRLTASPSPVAASASSPRAARRSLACLKASSVRPTEASARPISARTYLPPCRRAVSSASAGSRVSSNRKARRHSDGRRFRCR
jgi:hypothetical protein